jgi:hypothetical protein
VLVDVLLEVGSGTQVGVRAPAVTQKPTVFAFRGELVVTGAYRPNEVDEAEAKSKENETGEKYVPETRRGQTCSAGLRTSLD